MAKYRNNKPGVLGLTFKSDKDKPSDGAARTVGPGEVFEADSAEVPEHYLKQGWIVEAGKDDQVGPPMLDQGEPARTTADQPLAPPPAQTAGTPDAQRSAEQQRNAEQQRAGALHDKGVGEQPSDDKRNKR